ncbi:unnamed protein product [Pleuronectes platessa]|uniref:Uncharacterized protein n=1 Tax=Pleuronectes platessa TaxID=8262 RepID=A0A9N7UX74_PLEPL|nr:unnamed protein product [Pleuronectes platessa]
MSPVAGWEKACPDMKPIMSGVFSVALDAFLRSSYSPGHFLTASPLVFLHAASFSPLSSSYSCSKLSLARPICVRVQRDTEGLGSAIGFQAQGQTFTFPDIFPEKEQTPKEGSVEEMQEKFMEDEKQRQRLDPRRGGSDFVRLQSSNESQNRITGGGGEWSRRRVEQEESGAGGEWSRRRVEEEESGPAPSFMKPAHRTESPQMTSSFCCPYSSCSTSFSFLLLIFGTSTSAPPPSMTRLLPLSRASVCTSPRPLPPWGVIRPSQP